MARPRARWCQKSVRYCRSMAVATKTMIGANSARHQRSVGNNRRNPDNISQFHSTTANSAPAGTIGHFPVPRTPRPSAVSLSSQAPLFSSSSQASALCRLGGLNFMIRQDFCEVLHNCWSIPSLTMTCATGRPAMSSPEVMALSETDQLRQQLLQAQRLSSVGAIASSVAHEFNNILTTIINYAKLGLRPQCTESERLLALEKILKGTQRAATIINSMLGFARNNSTLRAWTDIAGL